MHKEGGVCSLSQVAQRIDVGQQLFPIENRHL